MRLIFDAHLDLAWCALQWDRDLTQPLAALRSDEAQMTDHRARGKATVSLPEMQRGGIGICLGTVLSRSKPSARKPGGFSRRDLDFNNQTAVSAIGFGQLEYYKLLEASGHITILRTADALRKHAGRWIEQRNGPVGVIIAMEGADPIRTPDQAVDWFARGLRCVGIAHYGQHPYAAGTGATGPITASGRELLQVFEQLGMVLDLTHCAEPGFFDALELFSGKIIASHNMCRSLVPGDRQFSDDQLRALIQRGAIIGMAFDAWMLKPGYKAGQEPRDATTLSNVADHIDHICQIAGSTKHVGIGSDLDGGYGYEQTPLEIESIADLQKLAPILKSRGYSDADVDAIFFGNYLRFFTEALPSS